MKDKPLCFEYNFGLGFRYADVDILNPFTIGGETIDPLEGFRMETKTVEKVIEDKPKEVMQPNLDFDVAPIVNDKPKPTELNKDYKPEDDFLEYKEPWETNE